MEILYIGIIAAFITMFLNYCIGKPGSEKFSPYEIFSFYTVWLSERRLEVMGLLDTYTRQYNENVKTIKSRHDLATMKADYQRVVYEAAEPFFTWERAAGMCPVCTGFWVALACGLIFTQNFVFLISIIVISHITIRLLAKVI